MVHYCWKPAPVPTWCRCYGGAAPPPSDGTPCGVPLWRALTCSPNKIRPRMQRCLIYGTRHSWQCKITARPGELGGRKMVGSYMLCKHKMAHCTTSRFVASVESEAYTSSLKQRLACGSGESRLGQMVSAAHKP